MRVEGLRAELAVVGGGLAGLACAYHARDLSPMVIESAERCGGRVLSVTNGGSTFDLGAAIAYRDSWAPFEFRGSRVIQESGPIGLSVGGRVIVGESPADCIHRAVDGAECGAEIDEHALADSFFRVIHPGDPAEYCSGVRQRDRLRRFSGSHRVGGNHELVGALESRLGGQLLLSTRALRIEEDGDHVTITVRRNDRDFSIIARAAVAATTASEALRLLPSLPEAERRFLSAVRYGRYVVVAMGIRAELPSLSYIVTPAGPMDVVSLQHAVDAGLRVVLCYFGGRSAAWTDGLPDQELVERVVRAVEDLLALEGLGRSLVFSRVQRWEEGGTVISPLLAAPRSTADLVCGFRLVLAGDYLAAPYPYGMQAALRSGESAAATVRQLLRDS